MTALLRPTSKSMLRHWGLSFRSSCGESWSVCKAKADCLKIFSSHYNSPRRMQDRAPVDILDPMKSHTTAPRSPAAAVPEAPPENTVHENGSAPRWIQLGDAGYRNAGGPAVAGAHVLAGLILAAKGDGRSRACA